ncbi:hypothetical protein GCM10022600_02480 [Qipengyuania pelagi]|uniref:Uncharacterized protein n=1 Tax=Qipengyuania pelagi TaxID=994320 RepID=A0A844YBM5_9SPHN|nr:hypothetical protein [Qipengyuania pelagi]MXO54633.1 hypothetical protein [Qipengyuania pelagi]
MSFSIYSSSLLIPNSLSSGEYVQSIVLKEHIFYRLEITFEMSEIGEMHSLKIFKSNSENSYILEEGDYRMLEIDGVEICTDFILSEAPFVPAIDGVRFVKDDKVVAKWFFDGKDAADHFRFEF